MSEATKVPADTFHQFAFLPKELRLQIWNYALKPRIIPLHRTNDSLKGRGILFPMRVATIGFMGLSTNRPALDILPKVCPEARLVCQRRFMNFDIWDLIKSRYGTFFDPLQDVLYFTDAIDASILLEFATQYPSEAAALKTIALPGVLSSVRISRKEILAALHSFGNLEEVIITIGKASTDKHGISWLGGMDVMDSWVLPRSAEEALEKVRKERWAEWKVPKVSIVQFQEKILSNERIAIWGLSHSSHYIS